jgi:hypothetical protein
MQPHERVAPDPDVPNPTNSRAMPALAGAGPVESHAEKLEISEEIEQPQKKRISLLKVRKDQHLIEYEVIKRFLTGDRADRELEEIMFEIGELARKEMLVA